MFLVFCFTDTKITKLHGQSEFLSSNCVFDKHKDFVREDVYHQENLPSKNTTEVQKDCPVCQYFRTNSAQISGKDETGVVRVFGV